MKMQSYFKSEEYKRKIISVYESVLKNWIKPNETRFINTKYGRTFVIETGDKKKIPLILLHGSGSNSFMWSQDVKEYCKWFRVFALDIPGEAGKSEEYRASWESDDFTYWMDEVYRTLGIKSAAIIGISLGGWIALKWAITFPYKVSKLVVMCPSGLAPPRKSFLFKALLYALLGSYGMKKMTQLIFNKKDIHPDVSNYFQIMSKGFIFRQGAPPLFTDESIKKLSMPLLFLGGDKDIMIDNNKSARRLKQLIPHAFISIKKDMGHAITGVQSQIVGFLTNNKLSI